MKTFTNKEILNNILAGTKPINFHALFGDKTEGLKRNEIIVSVIDGLLENLKQSNWSLAKKDELIYAYNGCYWNMIPESELKNFLGEVAKAMGIPYYTAQYYQFHDHLLKQFQASAYLPFTEANNNNILINLLNGTFEITEEFRDLREFQKDDFLTYQLPFKYDEDATCPIFEEYLQTVLPNHELQQLLFEFLGSVFIKTSQLKLEKCLLLYGSGANGKSVFFEVVNALLGKDNVSNFSLANLAEENSRALIMNKLLNYGSELRGGNIESDIFKALSSGEPIQARFKYKNSFQIHDYAKLCFNCNELPKDVEHTEAYFRQFLIIPFEVTIPEKERNPELSKIIIEKELSGIFNLVIAGLDRVWAQKNYTHCSYVSDAVKQYKDESDSTFQFYHERGYRKSNSFISLKSFYDDYREYCREDNYRPVSKKNFNTRMKNNFGIEYQRISQGTMVFVEKSIEREVTENDINKKVALF